MDGAYTVRELTEAIQLALGSWLPNEIWVQGQVADLSRSAAGHAYFQLIEPGENGRAGGACISVTLLDSARQHVNAVLRQAGGTMRMVDGTRIRVRGRLEFYEQKGRLQLRMSGIDPSYTLGLLLSERDRVLRTLAAEGLVERNRQLDLSPVPLRLGLVTSHGSAAMADFLTELERSRFSWQVVFADTRVQGSRSAATIVTALLALARHEVDAIALVRGGGARTDLASFDDEAVARAIAGLAVPVFTGIGHETDSSVADAVAHSSHKTPTACAAALVAHVGHAATHLAYAWTSIVDAASTFEQRAGRDVDTRARDLTVRARRRVDAAEHAIVRERRQAVRDASTALSRAQLMLARDAGQLHGAARHQARSHQVTIDRLGAQVDERSGRAIAREARRLDANASRVKNLDPERVLRRGWSMTRTSAGTVVRSAGELRSGDEIITVFADGETTSRVSAVALTPDARLNEENPDAE